MDVIHQLKTKTADTQHIRIFTSFTRTFIQFFGGGGGGGGGGWGPWDDASHHGQWQASSAWEN